MSETATAPTHAPAPEGWKVYLEQLIAAEINSFARYADRIIQYAIRPNDSGSLLARLECAQKCQGNQGSEALAAQPDAVELYLLNGSINHCSDIEELLAELKPRLGRRSRLVLVAYNPYFHWLYRLANALGLRRGEQPGTFLTRAGLQTIAKLSGYEVLRCRLVGYCPLRLMGLDNAINYLFPLIPILRFLAPVAVITLRPIVPVLKEPTVTVLIPARNERGNIEAALTRMPQLGPARMEIIFVEGHSSDGTWAEISRVLPHFHDRFHLAAFQQSGKGKNDAVRLGFSKAKHELVMILDADLTMPPELLTRFYAAYCAGHADFINGNRLLYPSEGREMKFLNRIANVFFAKVLSLILELNIGDSLCGTKVLLRADYQRFLRWREDFGDFDPFGDFELLFPAAVLGVGVIDLPLRYRERVYGSTNIRRFYHGWMLLKMALIGLLRLRTGKLPPAKL